MLVGLVVWGLQPVSPFSTVPPSAGRENWMGGNWCDYTWPMFEVLEGGRVRLSSLPVVCLSLRSGRAFRPPSKHTKVCRGGQGGFCEFLQVQGRSLKRVGLPDQLCFRFCFYLWRQEFCESEGQATGAGDLLP